MEKAIRSLCVVFMGCAMDVRRIRVYVMGLILTTLVMSGLFGVIFVFIREINIVYVVLILVAMLGVWGVNTYYLIRMIDLEERSVPGAGEG
ncbi:MAG: hypothetical protein RQ885_15190 [Desulfurococcales archaeon]|nr:hypothetical protein [Desulfurococcales archaeon]